MTESEKFFSAMGRLTCLRSSMGQERLNSLLMLHIHREMSMSLPIKEVIEQFVSGFWKTRNEGIFR